MSKTLRYIFLLIFSLIWLVGCSGDFAKFLLEKNLIADDYRYGDLYRFANLSQFRIKPEKCSTIKPEKVENLSLYIMGDSFTEAGRLSKDDFVATNYERFFISKPAFIKLDKTKKNVLIIETVERHFRERFDTTYKNLQIIDNQLLTNKKATISWLDYDLPYNAERHESALFGYDFFEKIKEIKAAINYKLLDKIDDNVALSKDGKILLYSLDTKAGINSCFDKISDEQIKKMSRNVENTVEYYQKLGFDKVILSIIPNKTSLYAQDLGEYNHLIERVQSTLQSPYIDVFSTYKNTQKMLYDIGDSHWNCEGRQIWVDKVNEELRNGKTVKPMNCETDKLRNR